MAKMAKIGYERVSTIEQDLTIQLEQLKQAECDKIFSGKHSGNSDENEVQLAKLIDYVCDDDVVIVTKLDRLGRSLKSILQSIESIHEKQAHLKTLDGAIDTSNNSLVAKATTNLIGVFAQLERDLNIQRTSEGREKAKAQGVHLGRPKTISDEDRVKIKKALAKGVFVTALARKYNVSHTTIARIRNENE